MATENIVVKVEQEELVVVKEETVDLTEESVYDIPTEALVHSSSIISKGLHSEVDGNISPSCEHEDVGQSLGKRDFMNSLNQFRPPVVPSFTMPYMSHAIHWGMHPPSTYLPYPYYQFPMSPFQMHNYPHMFGQVQQPNILLSSTPLPHLNGNQKVTTRTSFRNQDTLEPIPYTINQHQDFHSNLNLDKRPLPPGKMKKRPHATSTPYNRAESNLRPVISHAIRLRPTEHNPSSNMPEQPILSAYQLDVSLHPSDPDDSSKIDNLSLDSGPPFKCEHCGKGFVKKGYLTMHMQSHMPKVKSHKCTECDKSFAYKYHLSMHMKLHTQNDRTYVCKKCGKDFARKCHLSNHKRIHTEKKYFACGICDRIFISKADIKKHFSKHIPEKTGDINYNEL